MSMRMILIMQINSGKVVAIYFWADWWGPCHEISPVFERLSDAFDLEGIEYYKVDVDEIPNFGEDIRVVSYSIVLPLSSFL